MAVSRATLPLLVVMGLFSFASEVMFVVFGAWLEDAYGLSLLALGGAAIVIGLSELTGEGATLVITDRLGKRRSVAIGLVLSIIGFGLMGSSPGTVGVGIGFFAIGLVGFEFTIVSAIPLASEANPQARSRYLAWMVVAFSISRSAGAAIGPAIFRAEGLALNAAVAVAADLVALALLLTVVREAPSGADGGADQPGSGKFPLTPSL